MNKAHSKNYRRARVHPEQSWTTVKTWLSKGLADLRRHPRTSIGFGGAACVMVWFGAWGLTALNLGWMILPAAAGAVLIGPVATSALYQLARDDGRRTGTIHNSAQFLLIGTILTVFALVWIRAATILFAVFFGLRPFAGSLETVETLVTTPEGLGLVVTGSIVGGLFAALGFAVSAFSVPMLVDREVDAFSAMGLSFNAVTHNFRLTLIWAGAILSLTLLSALTGFLGFVVAYPLLGFATWHAYSDLFHHDISSEGALSHVSHA